MIERHTLKNGLRVMGQKVEGSLATSVLVMIKTGSRNESDKIHGISHFLEHVCFKGTTKRPSYQDIYKEIDSMGALSNAFTGKEYTGYYLKVDRRHFEQSLDLLSDMVYNSTFPEEEIIKERGTLLEEINMYEDDPSTFSYMLFDRIIYKNSLMARDDLGSKEAIKSLTSETIRSYRDKYYVAGNSIVSCVGNLPDDYLEKIEKYFGSAPSGKTDYLPESLNKVNEKKVILKKKKTEQSHLIIGVSSHDIHDKDRYAVDILSVILGGNWSSRLFREIREKRGLAYHIASMTDRGSDTGAFLVKAGLNTQKTEEAVKIIIKVLEEIKGDITQDEFDCALKYIEGSLALSEENSLVVAEKNAIEDILGAKALTIEERFKRYEKVTLEDVKRMAEEIFKREQMKLAVIGPFENEDKFVKILES